MATKDQFSSLWNKNNIFADDNSALNSDAQYRNLNVNADWLSSPSVPCLSKSVSNDNGKNYQTFQALNKITDYNYDFSKERKISMKNENPFSKPYGYPNLSKADSQDPWKKQKYDSDVKNRSTLSFHISAYENSAETAMDSLLDKKISTKNSLKNHVVFGKTLKDLKQLFIVSSIQNPFEFPRQSNGEEQEAEIMRFRASQRLLNPDADKYQAVIDYATELEMDDESLTLLLAALAKKERESGGRNQSEDWNMLASLVCRKRAFQNYAQRLIDESRPVNPEIDQYQAVVDYANGLGMDAESFTRLLLVLSEEERTLNGPENSPHWNMLARLIGQQQAFQNYARQLIDRSRQENNQNYLRRGYGLQDELYQNGVATNSAIKYLDNHRQLIGHLFSSGVAMWKRLPDNSKKLVLECISNIVEKAAIHFNFGTIGTGASKIISTLGKRCWALAFIPVAVEAGRSVWHWFTGAISGKRAVKNTVDSLLSTLAGLGAALAVGAIGTALFCSGIGIVCGVVAGFAGGVWSQKHINEFSAWLCGIPKTEALENAYRYLNVHHQASVEEVHAAYRRRALIDHPDQGGNHEAFCKLQTYMAIIRAAREAQ